MAKKNSRLEHAVKKSNRPLYAALAVAALTLVSAAFYGACAAFSRLSQACLEQCRITDANVQVSIATGKLLPARLVANHFGLTNGANAAEIPYGERRERFLADMPNARDVRITRKSPNFVHVEVVERTPTARIASALNAATITRCVDSDGVVFYYPPRETALLPIIRVAGAKTPKDGSAVDGLAKAALRLAEEAAADPFNQLKIQDVDASGKDFLVATLGDAARAKLAWADMDVDSPSARESLRRQLSRLQHAIQTKVAEGARLWNATDYGTPGRVYATDPLAAGN